MGVSPLSFSCSREQQDVQVGCVLAAAIAAVGIAVIQEYRVVSYGLCCRLLSEFPKVAVFGQELSKLPLYMCVSISNAYYYTFMFLESSMILRGGSQWVPSPSNISFSGEQQDAHVACVPAAAACCCCLPLDIHTCRALNHQSIITCVGILIHCLFRLYFAPHRVHALTKKYSQKAGSCLWTT